MMVSGSLYFTLPSHRHSEPVRLFPPEPDDRARNLGNWSHVLSCAFSHIEEIKLHFSFTGLEGRSSAAGVLVSVWSFQGAGLNQLAY